MEAAGVQVTGYYVNNPAGNVSGGMSQGATYTDNLFIGIEFDLKKLVHWNGATFFISGVDRNGTSLTNKYVGSQYNSQQVYGGQNVFLYQVFLQMQLAASRAARRQTS